MYRKTYMNDKQWVIQTAHSGASRVSNDHDVLTDPPTETLGLQALDSGGGSVSSHQMAH